MTDEEIIEAFNEESLISTDVDASPAEINEFDTTQAVQPTQIEYAKKKTPVIPCKKADNSDTNADYVIEDTIINTATAFTF